MTPQELRQQLASELHNALHTMTADFLAFNAIAPPEVVLDAIEERYYWPWMRVIRELHHRYLESCGLPKLTFEAIFLEALQNERPDMDRLIDQVEKERRSPQ
jgi:hypothetical protein